MRRIVFHPAAEEEIARSAQYYRLRAAKLGEDFTAQIERTVKRIQENPMAAVLVGTRARRRICKRFPFAVVYRLSEPGDSRHRRYSPKPSLWLLANEALALIGRSALVHFPVCVATE